MSGDYLLRAWGGDISMVEALQPPDRLEPKGFVRCYWFATVAEREAFLSAWPPQTKVVRNCVDPGPDSDGEIIDTHALTVAHVVLRTPEGETYQCAEAFGYGYPSSAAHGIWEHGNNSCDCNKRLMIARALGRNDPKNEDNPCGDTIALVSCEIRQERTP